MKQRTSRELGTEMKQSREVAFQQVLESTPGYIVLVTFDLLSPNAVTGEWLQLLSMRIGDSAETCNPRIIRLSPNAQNVLLDVLTARRA